MNGERESLEDRLAELRQAFDESFASPAQPRNVEQENLLAIQIGGGHFAIRVSELAGVQACRKIVPLPGAAVGLLGVVGIRGRLVAAYRLADLVGAGPSDGHLRWLLVCREDMEIGLAVEGLDAYIRVDKGLIHPAQEGEEVGEHICEVLLHAGRSLGVLHVRSILAAITMRAKDAPHGRNRE